MPIHNTTSGKVVAAKLAGCTHPKATPITARYAKSNYCPINSGKEMLRKSGRIFPGEPGVLTPWLLCCYRSTAIWHSKVTRVITDPARLKLVWFRLVQLGIRKSSSSCRMAC